MLTLPVAFCLFSVALAKEGEAAAEDEAQKAKKAKQDHAGERTDRTH